MRRDGRNPDCIWPGESPERSPTPGHLSADAEFAEDLAIRYADAHHGLRTPGYVSGEDYASARGRCIVEMFQQVAKTHNVSAATVSASLGRNRSIIDLGIILPFALLYSLVAAIAARIIWRRYPPAADGIMPGILMSAFIALVFASLSTMAGEQWNWMIETCRIDNRHMSYRVQRLWWGRHRPEIFVGALLIFGAMSLAVASRRLRSKTLAQAQP